MGISHTDGHLLPALQQNSYKGMLELARPLNLAVLSLGK